MKNMILRILIGTILCSFLAGIAVAIIGLMLGWKTPTQFSDGLFWAGAIVILLGFASWRGYSRGTFRGPPVHMDPTERSRLWAADTWRGKNLIAVLGISGLLLFGSAIVVSLVGGSF